MAWKCVECVHAADGGDGRSSAVDAVCVHCGKPLCGQHKFEIVDEAFVLDPELGAKDNRAVHCEECRSRYHSVA
jgi:hypothetical protein